MQTQWLQSIFVWLCLTLMANPIFIFSLQAEDPPPNPLSTEEKRFDLDDNQQLSDVESRFMIEILTQEVLTGTTFSEREIRQLGQRPSGGRSRSKGRGQRGEVNSRRVQPQELEIKDGSPTIPDRETFEILSYQGDELRRDTHLSGLEFVKFQLENGGTDKAQLYFMNTNTYRGHQSFMREMGLARAGKEQMRGVLTYRPFTQAPNGQLGIYTFEFEPNDAYPFDMVQFAYNQLIAKAPILKGRLGYCPLWGALDIYQQEEKLYQAAGLPVYFEDDLYADIGYLPLNTGESFGRLRLMELDQRPSPRDVVIYQTLPNEMPRVSGIITAVRQTPLSHVNLRAIQDKLPNAFITEAANHQSIQPLMGQFVYYRVRPDGFEIRAATRQEVDAHFANIRPTETQHPKRDLSVTQIRALDDIEFADSISVGVKSANIATMRDFGWAEGTVPNGFAIPFYFYDQFMQHNGFYQYVRQLLADPEFQQQTKKQESELKKLRKKIRKGEMPAWMMVALNDLYQSFPTETRLRCRSSTNNEDLPGFSGAGLYDSFTHKPSEGHLAHTIKQVFASLWNVRAFEERQFYHIDHLTTAMGVLVHPNYEGELANGVAVTDDILYQTNGNNYLNTQVGEDLVTNPQATSIPEEILLDWWDSSRYRLVTSSNQVTSGQQILTEAHLAKLGNYLGVIHQRFSRLYGRSDDYQPFAMEIEFKITQQSQVVIKQARPWIY